MPKIVIRTRLDVTFIHTLSVLFARLHWFCSRKITSYTQAQNFIRRFVTQSNISYTIHDPSTNQISIFLDISKNYRTWRVHWSRYLNCILIISNEMQQYAGVYLLQNYSTCFGCLSHPSSGVHQTVTAASGTGHSVRATTSAPTLWPVPDVAVTVWGTPDDGCDRHPKHVE